MIENAKSHNDVNIDKVTEVINKCKDMSKLLFC